MTWRKNSKSELPRPTNLFELPYFVEIEGRWFSRARILIDALEHQGVDGARLAGEHMDHVEQYSHVLDTDGNDTQRSLQRVTFNRLLSEAILSALNLGMACAETPDANALLVRELIARQRQEAGKRGAAKRHQPLAELRSFAEERYRAKRWHSAAEAARKLLPEVTAYAKVLNAKPFTDANAVNTLTKWLRAAKKLPPSS